MSASTVLLCDVLIDVTNDKAQPAIHAVVSSRAEGIEVLSVAVHEPCRGVSHGAECFGQRFAEHETGAQAGADRDHNMQEYLPALFPNLSADLDWLRPL